MGKEIRKATRCFIIKNNKVVCIKYKIGDVGYYDIPGGKIEEGETPIQTFFHTLIDTKKEFELQIKTNTKREIEDFSLKVNEKRGKK